MTPLSTKRVHQPPCLSAIRQGQRVNSYDFWKQLNLFREDAGENPVQHRDFLKRVSNECEIGVSETFVHPQNGQVYPCVYLDHDQMMLVGMRESKVVRKKVLEWLKTIDNQTMQPAYQLPQNFAEALRLAADLQDQAEQHTRIIEQQRPKVEYHDRLMNSSGGMCLRDALKSIGCKPNNATEWLRVNGYLGWGNKPYQKDIEAGRFELKQFQDYGGSIHTQTLVTAKGAEWLYRVLSQQSQEVRNRVFTFPN